MDTEKKDINTESEAQIISSADFEILVSEEDKVGSDILAMSDFFENYVNNLALSIRMNSSANILPSIPFADLGLINEVIHHAEVVARGDTQLLPDFDHLPKDILKKLKDGVYKVGESRQVDGNLRAVIVDETGTRVKDVTLKEVRIDPNTIEASRSITSQLQMRQIYAKLDSIQEMQDYQIARDRDRDILVPFFDARDLILEAQSPDCIPSARVAKLEQASEKLRSVINSLYTDISTSTGRLVNLTRFPLFQRREQIQRYIGSISENLMLSTKIVGLRLQILDYMGDKAGVKAALDTYQRRMGDFFTMPIPGKRLTAAQLIHQNFPYTDENRNAWYQLGIDIKPKLAALESGASEHIYLVSMEDVNDGERREEMLDL